MKRKYRKRCKEYVGVTCVDGSCPKANAEEYEERGMDVTKSCNKCIFYEGCEDCAPIRYRVLYK